MVGDRGDPSPGRLFQPQSRPPHLSPDPARLHFPRQGLRRRLAGRTHENVGCRSRRQHHGKRGHGGLPRQSEGEHRQLLSRRSSRSTSSASMSCTATGSTTTTRRSRGRTSFLLVFPPPTRVRAAGRPITICPAGGVKEAHIIAVPNKNAHSRFYLLGGCDVGKILFRPQFLVDGEKTSPATPLNRQYRRAHAGYGLPRPRQGFWPCSPTTSPIRRATTR